MPKRPEKGTQRELTQGEKDQLISEVFVDVRTQLAKFTSTCVNDGIFSEHDEVGIGPLATMITSHMGETQPISRPQLRKATSEMVRLVDTLMHRIVAAAESKTIDMAIAQDLLHQGVELSTTLEPVNEAKVKVLAAKADHIGVKSLADTFAQQADLVGGSTLHDVLEDSFKYLV